MSIRQEPSVVDYNRSSYDSYGRPVAINTTSNPGYTVHTEPQYQTHTVSHVPQTQVRVQDRRTGANYDEYRNTKYEYKYNIYSLIDEPWNRCCEVGKCGNCPGNECIARRAPKLDWI
jgi:hypothetical protein